VAERCQQLKEYVETKGKSGIGRLMISMPPRHGKSELCTKRFPAWLLGLHPDWHIAMCAYGDELSADFSRAVRHQCAESEAYHQLFPTINVHPQSSAVQRWSLADTTDLGNPNVVATGIGGSLTGRGFEVIIVDDPLKSREEAESKAVRDYIHEAYRGTIRPRLNPFGAILIISTRWHEDDLQGWLLSELQKGEGEKWVVINLPAIAEENDPLGRQVGESLWEKRFPLVSLLETKTALGSYDWNSQYQGHPKPPEGGRIHRAWIKTLPQLPAKFLPGPNGEKPSEVLRWYRYWDLALTVKTTSDYTASARVAFDSEGYLYIADMIRGRWEWPDCKRIIKETMINEKSLGVKHGIEKALHGLSAVQEFMRDPDLHGVAFEGVDVEGDKLTRALPFIARAEADKVRAIAGEWVGAFLDEISAFTGHNDAHDDQVDTISGGIFKLGSAVSLSAFTQFYKNKALKKTQEQAQDAGKAVVDAAPLPRASTEAAEAFRHVVELAAETDSTITPPGDLDLPTVGDIMSDVASAYIKRHEDLKAIHILNERKRLGL